MSGHPSLRPPVAVCYLPRTPALAAAELALEQRALLAIVAGARSGISASEVQSFICDRFRLPMDAFSVHRWHHDEFLLRFRVAADRARVAAGNTRGPRFRLLMQPWCRLTGGEPVTARFHVSIEMGGISDHA